MPLKITYNERYRPSIEMQEIIVTYSRLLSYIINDFLFALVFAIIMTFSSLICLIITPFSSILYISSN